MVFVPFGLSADICFVSHSTCFWAGDTFCPKLMVKGRNGQNVPVQKFLQEAFMSAWEVLVRVAGSVDAVIGFEVKRFNPHSFG